MIAGRHPLVEGTATGAAMVLVSIGDVFEGEGAVRADGRFGGSLDTTLAEGPHLIEVFAEDAAGNLSPSASVAVIVDASPPSIGLKAPSAVRLGETFTVAVTASEAITGLTAAKFAIANGTAVGFSGAGASFELKVNAARTGSGRLDITLPAGAASDLRGNATTVASTASVDLPDAGKKGSGGRSCGLGGGAGLILGVGLLALGLRQRRR